MHRLAPARELPSILKIMALIAVAAMLSTGGPAFAAVSFPRKPIKVVVYTGPGGSLDTTARKFADVAKKYTDATFVVENKPGAGGIVAIERVLQMPANGYTLCACTKSIVAKVVSVDRLSYLDALHWVGLLIKDPECVIVRRDGPVDTGGPMEGWKALLADAHQGTGNQKWLGPAVGGQDHVFAMKTWRRFEIPADWVPFSSGNEALAALLGDQGTAYVGNPRDTVGNPNLRMIAVSSARRLLQFPDTPVFSELGAPDLDNEYMWRGFALKQGCPALVLRWYDELFRKITADEQWRSFWEKEGMEVVYDDATTFTEVVNQDCRDFLLWVPRPPPPTVGRATRTLAWCLPLFVCVGAVCVTWHRIATGKTLHPGQLVIPSVILVVALFCFVRTLTFPHVQGVGAAAVPRLWITLLTPLCVYAYFAPAGKDAAQREKPLRTDLVWWYIGLLTLYVACTVYLGYYLSSAAFLIAAMYLLGVHNRRTACLVTAAWLTFAFLAFGHLLKVPLPLGRFFETLL